MNEDYSATVYYPHVSNRFDHLVRVKESEDNTGGYDVLYMGETEAIAHNIFDLARENIVLKRIMKNLWKIHAYNQEYISFLLGTYSQEEFGEIARNFAEPINTHANTEYIASATKVIFSVFGQTLATSDLSLMLDVDNSCIEDSLPLLGYSPEETEG